MMAIDKEELFRLLSEGRIEPSLMIQQYGRVERDEIDSCLLLSIAMSLKRIGDTFEQALPLLGDPEARINRRIRGMVESGGDC